MPMTRAKKSVLLTEIDQTLASAKGAVFANYQGLTVKQLSKLRGKLHEQQMTGRVMKNTILRLVLRKHGITIDETILSKPILLVASDSDEVGPAKLIKGLQKDLELLGIAGGLLGKEYLAGPQVSQLASLPSRDQLRAQVVGVLAAPLQRLVGSLQSPLSGIVNVLNNYQTKQAESV
ncbi:50S ribosomal protein L10 [Candidatus Berkelbacteria bacterium]|nr:50S ribosomal protein L10 [Candidatus Berkelbacteria bacterium]